MNKTVFFFLFFKKLLEDSSFLTDVIWGVCVLKVVISIAQVGLHTYEACLSLQYVSLFHCELSATVQSIIVIVHINPFISS